MSRKEFPTKIFLFLGDSDEVTMRSLDRIEENLASEHGLDNFRADQCVTKIEMKNVAMLFEELKYTYPVCFGYE